MCMSWVLHGTVCKHHDIAYLAYWCTTCVYSFHSVVYKQCMSHDETFQNTGNSECGGKKILLSKVNMQEKLVHGVNRLTIATLCTEHMRGNCAKTSNCSLLETSSVKDKLFFIMFALADVAKDAPFKAFGAQLCLPSDAVSMHMLSSPVDQAFEEAAGPHRKAGQVSLIHRYHCHWATTKTDCSTGRFWEVPAPGKWSERTKKNVQNELAGENKALSKEAFFGWKKPHHSFIKSFSSGKPSHFKWLTF